MWLSGERRHHVTMRSPRKSKLNCAAELTKALRRPTRLHVLLLFPLHTYSVPLPQVGFTVRPGKVAAVVVVVLCGGEQAKS